VEPDLLAVCDVLLVEDDIDLGDAIASSLKRKGLDVRTVPSASSALGVLQRVRPRVAVLDHNLPGESGLALAERIHKILPDLPIGTPWKKSGSGYSSTSLCQLRRCIRRSFDSSSRLDNISPCGRTDYARG
jgi:hypothetical protein